MPLLKEFSLGARQYDMATRRMFDLQTRSITSLYERLFPKYKTTECWKVLVNCVNDTPTTQYRNIGGVYELDIIADIATFFSLTDIEKKVWAFEYLKLGIIGILKQTGWETELFMKTFQKVEQLNLRNVWLWKAVHSPSGKLVAELWIDHNVQSCVISLVVRDRSGQEIKRQELITDLPSEWAFVRHLGIVTWRGSNQVALVNREGNQIWQVEI